MQTTLDEIQRIIDEQIGPAAQMQFRVARCDGESLHMRAPLAANLNHHGSGFGGSLYSICAVAGWALLLYALREAGLDGWIVIREARVRYLRPLREDLQVRIAPAQADGLAAALADLRSRGAARVSLRASIADRGRAALAFEGEFSIKTTAPAVDA